MSKNTDRFVINIKRDEYFSELRDFVDNINPTSMTKPSNFLRHLIYRGWLEFKETPPDDISMANLNLNELKTLKEKPAKTSIKKEEPPTKPTVLDNFSKLGV